MIELKQHSSNWSLNRWIDCDNRSGVDPRSRYVDHFWIPALGPTAVCLARALMRMVAREGKEVVVRGEDLEALLGLRGSDASDVLSGALDLLVEHGIVHLDLGGPADVPKPSDTDGVTVLVRSSFPYLTDEAVERLPGDLAIAHRAPHSLRAAATLDAPMDRSRDLGPHLRVLSIAATIDEIIVNPSLDPGQLAFRWQHVVRLAEEARDDAVLDWAPTDLESTLAECHLAAQAVNEELWSAQCAIATRRSISDHQRSALAESAAGLVDWLVSEYPQDPSLDGDF
ncbi:MAG: hypothetical protein KDB02_01130 [Acidimicrobiales bacterium]|nr:hypothetical protein [Acidimicrobiales bacterium]